MQYVPVKTGCWSTHINKETKQAMYTPSMVTPVADKGKERFYEEVIRGLRAVPKYLSSKYLYDAAGDRIFQQIMHCPEYYLTRCEMEILSKRAAAIAHLMKIHAGMFDVVELGPGDTSKSILLLGELLKEKAIHTYFPIDISANVITKLKKELPLKLPKLQLNGLNGEYFDMLHYVHQISDRKKVLLFLGANIGNFTLQGAWHFCRQIGQYLNRGDLLLVGFDLKKNPLIIREAYHDKQGLTKAFNLNLLQRINGELQADFNLSQFDHYPTYDPHTGACKSYLVSLVNQRVHINRDITIPFKENETIYTEISQKYSPEEIDRLAIESGFIPLTKFYDHKKWFVDCLWQYG